MTGKPLTVGDAFSGIGGMSLGLQMAGGFETRWFIEIDDWCRRVLAKHWPDVPQYTDIRDVRGADLETIDVLTAGFPCQPVSLAGKGLAQADERWLWPEVARLVGELRPRWVLLENVPGLLGRGLGDVLGDLAACGYDAEWDCISAAAVGAPHIRDRVWIVAYPAGARCGEGLRASSGPVWDGARRAQPERLGSEVADPAIVGRGTGRTGRPDSSGSRKSEQSLPHVADAACQRVEGHWSAGKQEPQPSLEPWVFGRDGTGCGTGHWATEPAVGRVAPGIPRRVDRLRGLGNAVVPQVVAHVGRLILEAETLGRAAMPDAAGGGGAGDEW